MPLDSFGNVESFCSLIRPKTSILNKGTLGVAIDGWNSSTVELSPKGRRIGNHVEPFFFSSINMSRGGKLIFGQSGS